ncbi:hypothetical protein I6E72_05270 [Pseudoalteromonas sp. NSLLW24]|uniref:hypothetical protein n=2 Tax=unclassified Pseudoalteromonas TaxID=194690 RepID=UPI0018CC9153|nr:hypothetical protein [Pseudoalteromonas sp. NSLLW24]MBG9998369.1 hypothetical protein [Pseudoalteromonas sp. NSLLW24]
MINILGNFARLEELFLMLDAKLSEIDLAIQSSADPDSDGLFDQSEYYVGLGFVAAQQCLVETVIFSGLGKNKKAYKLGPRHRCGIAYVAAINSAADWWKHEAEWWVDLDIIKNSNATTVNNVLVISNSNSYQLSNLLFALSNNKEIKLKCLLPIITEWEHALTNWKNK